MATWSVFHDTHHYFLRKGWGGAGCAVGLIAQQIPPLASLQTFRKGSIWFCFVSDFLICRYKFNGDFQCVRKRNKGQNLDKKRYSIGVWRKLRNDLYNLYSSSNTTGLIIRPSVIRRAVLSDVMSQRSVLSRASSASNGRNHNLPPGTFCILYTQVLYCSGAGVTFIQKREGGSEANTHY
jgi:hypothetical protein